MSDVEDIQRPQNARTNCVVALAFVGIPLALVVSAVLYVNWTTGLLTPHMSDDELEAWSRTNRVELERLVSTFQEAQLTRIDDTSIYPGEAIASDRVAEVRSLMNNLDPILRMDAWEADSVLVIIEWKGHFFNSSQKGLAWRAEKPELLFDNLDSVPDGLRSGRCGYRHIDGAWYIFYRFDA